MVQCASTTVFLHSAVYLEKCVGSTTNKGLQWTVTKHAAKFFFENAFMTGKKWAVFVCEIFEVFVFGYKVRWSFHVIYGLKSQSE